MRVRERVRVRERARGSIPNENASQPTGRELRKLMYEDGERFGFWGGRHYACVRICI